MSHKTTTPRQPGSKRAHAGAASATAASPVPETCPALDLRALDPDEPITILLVDDDDDCRSLIRDAISECKVGNTIFECRNGAEALDFLYRRGPHANAPRPGLVYLDIEMPGLDGQTVLRTIKGDPALRDIPVVMMTGVADEAQMAEAAVNGANSYTLKPASAEQFLRTVLASTSYWLTIHQYPTHHLPATVCRR